LSTPELRQRQALALLARDELWQQRQHLREAAGQYLVLGAFGMLICGAWVYLGAQTTAAMNIALIYTASPVLIAVGAAAFLGDRLAPRQMAGVLLALAGVMHVVVRGHRPAGGHLRRRRAVPAALCIVGDGSGQHAGLDLARHRPVGGGSAVARPGRLLDVRLVTKGAGCQPRGSGAVPGAAVRRPGGLAAGYHDGVAGPDLSTALAAPSPRAS
jgi:hypothetical protein